ncbi:MAG: efflux RND transporter periplasmic adaptor subunit, partial [Pseudomonadota bacterium]
QLDTIKLVGFIPETLVDRVEIGSVAGARLSSGREVTGKVTFISRSADMNTRTFRVDVEVENADLSIRDGQTAEIAIQSDGEIAHLLPQSALTLDNDGVLGVRTVVDEAAGFTPVNVIRDTTGGIWVGGLEDSVEVIVVGQEFVTDGVPVAVTYREATQ